MRVRACARAGVCARQRGRERQRDEGAEIALSDLLHEVEAAVDDTPEDDVCEHCNVVSEAITAIENRLTAVEQCHNEGETDTCEQLNGFERRLTALERFALHNITFNGALDFSGEIKKEARKQAAASARPSEEGQG